MQGIEIEKKFPTDICDATQTLGLFVTPQSKVHAATQDVVGNNIIACLEMVLQDL